MTQHEQIGAMRICSLLPSATEIVYALGLGDRLVAVTHECDYPTAVLSKPHATASIIDSASLSSAEIDAAVRDSLAADATIYHLDAALLADVQPDLVLTQELCAVCAVGPEEVAGVLCSLPSMPRTLSLEPTTVDEVLDSVVTVADACDVRERGLEVRESLRRRIQAVRDAVAGRPIPRVLTVEWLDPLFVGGHWVPEMVEFAGGVDILGTAGRPSRIATWEEVAAAQPDVIVVMPCGFGLERSIAEFERTPPPAVGDDLPAVRRDQVYVVDGSSYFNRPGPRIVDGIEILAHILHPDVWDESQHGSWMRMACRGTVPAPPKRDGGAG
jgi:iron complex transport system substrate-binding protein